MLQPKLSQLGEYLLIAQGRSNVQSNDFGPDGASDFFTGDHELRVLFRQ